MRWGQPCRGSLGPAILLGAPWRVDGALYNAALLHDIGKIGIRDEVLLAPRTCWRPQMLGVCPGTARPHHAAAPQLVKDL